jgi:limonene-1,2-epoxide hydrolase
MKAVLNGPQGKTALESTVLTIGSSPDNSLVIDNLKVSAHHAEIRPEEQGFSITDLGSIHGTYVNGERLDFNTPHMLNQGNSIAIGDMVFTYDVEDAAQIEPTPSTTSDQESSSGTPVAGDVETLAAHSAYGIGQVVIPQGNQQPAGANTQSMFPQQYMPPYSTQPGSPGTVPPGYVGPIPGYVPIEHVRRRNRLFIGIGLGLLVVIASAFAGYVFFTRSTPEKTLDTFCNAMQGQDYQIAYNQLASSLQSNETENVFAHTSQAVGKVNVCTHSSATVTGNLATANVTFVSSSGQTSNNTVTLTQDSSNTWKISMLPTSPSMTLTTFCSALQSRDYPTAYNQLSSGIRGQHTESQFEADFAGLTCSYGTVSLSGNTATTAMMFTDIAGRSVAASASLAQDSNSNNEWKIDSIRFL